MTRIVGLTARKTIVGRIRIGKKKQSQSGKTIPGKLNTFRATSPHRRYIEDIAARHGGSVEPWKNGRKEEWEVITEEPLFDIVVPRTVNLTQYYEARDAKGKVLHRCNGVTNLLTLQPCSNQCAPLDASEAEVRAAIERRDRRGVKEVSLLDVQVPGPSGSGLWRLASKGHFTAQEMLGAAEEMPYHIGQTAQLLLTVESINEKDFPVVGMLFTEPAVDPRIAQMALEQQAQQQVRTDRLHEPSTFDPDDAFGLGDLDEYDDEDVEQVAETTASVKGEVEEYIDEETGEVKPIELVFQHANTRQVKELSDLRRTIFNARSTPTQKEDEAWRQWLEAQFGVRSTTKMSYSQAEEAIRLLTEKVTRLQTAGV